MKDEEMQIEEMAIQDMARVFIKASCKGSECEKCLFIDSVEEAQECCVCLKAFYNAGYRKIPENSVVLTREEYNEMVEDVKVSKEKLARIIDSAKEKGSKETAEKILSEIWHNNFETIITIKNSCSKEDFENIGKGILISIRNKLKEIATREGVEIKEKMYENN